MAFNNTGSTTIEAGTLLLQRAFNNQGTVAIGADATLQSGNASFANAGRLSGNGTARAIVDGTLTNSGTVAPGASTGTLTIEGNFAQTAAGFFDVELQGMAHDLLVVTGSASLDGALDLICFADCAAAIGQSYKILDAAANELSGTFASINLFGFQSGAFNVVYDRANGDVLLNVTEILTPIPVPVPEPGTWLMFAVGGLLLLKWTERRTARI